MVQKTSCPTAAVWRDLLLGNSSEDDAIALEQHLASCAQCLQTVRGVHHDDTLVDAMRAGAARNSKALPQVQMIMQRLKGLQPAGSDRHEDETLTARSQTGAWGAAVDENALTGFLAPPRNANELGRLGPYRVLKILGHGGMGVVFQAEDERLQRSVALKAMLPELAARASAKERFLREARAAAAIEHDNIVAIYQVDEERGVPYIAMPLLKGKSLDDYLKGKASGRKAGDANESARASLKLPQILKLAREIARGLSAAHARGLIHRDIKPANIWLDSTAGGRVKILDFGLARLAAQNDQNLTQSGVILGTPAYMAPEQARGEKTDARADLFSLGVVIYRLCTGAMPFTGNDPISTLMAVALNDPPPPATINPEIPQALSDLVMKLLVKDPKQRLATANEVVQAIQVIEREQALRPAPGDSQTAAAVSATPVAPSRLKRRRLVALALLPVALLLAAGIFYIVTDNGTIEIATEDDTIKIVAERKGGQVTLIDPQSKQSWIVNTGEWTVRLDGNPDGLAIQMPTTFTLTRGGKQVVTVKRLKGPEAIAAQPASTLPEIKPLRQISWPGGRRYPALDISADGRHFLIVREQAGEATVRVWETQSGKVIHETPGWVGRFTPDNKVITCGWSDFHVFDLTTQKEVGSFDMKAQLFNFSLSKTGSRLMVVTPQGGQMWDWSTAKRLCSFPWTEDTPGLLTPDGRWILDQPGAQPPLRVLDAETGKPVKRFEELRQVERLSAISADGKQLLCVGKLYDVATGNEIAVSEGALGPRSYHGADFRRFVSPGKERNTYVLQETLTGRAIAVLRFPGPVEGAMDVQFSRDGSHLLCVGPDEMSYVFRLPQGPETEEPSGEILRLRWNGVEHVAHVKLSPDGRHLLACSWGSFTRLYDVGSGQLLHELDGWGADFTPDGQRIATVCGPEKGLTILLYDTASGKLIRKVGEHPVRTWGNLVISPDGKTAFTHADDEVLRLWDLEKGGLLHEWPREGGELMYGKFTPDGALLMVSKSGNPPHRFWDIKGRETPAFDKLAGLPFLGLLPGQREALLAEDGALWVVDAATGMKTSKSEMREALSAGQYWTPDFRRVLARFGREIFKVYDRGNPNVLARFEFPNANQYAVGLSANGRYATAATADGDIIVWRLPAIKVGSKPGAP